MCGRNVVVGLNCVKVTSVDAERCKQRHFIEAAGLPSPSDHHRTRATSPNTLPSNVDNYKCVDIHRRIMDLLIPSYVEFYPC